MFFAFTRRLSQRCKGKFYLALSIQTVIVCVALFDACSSMTFAMRFLATVVWPMLRGFVLGVHTVTVEVGLFGACNCITRGVSSLAVEASLAATIGALPTQTTAAIANRAILIREFFILSSFVACLV